VKDKKCSSREFTLLKVHPRYHTLSPIILKNKILKLSSSFFLKNTKMLHPAQLPTQHQPKKHSPPQHPQLRHQQSSSQHSTHQQQQKQKQSHQTQQQLSQSQQQLTQTQQQLSQTTQQAPPPHNQTHHQQLSQQVVRMQAQPHGQRPLCQQCGCPARTSTFALSSNSSPAAANSNLNCSISNPNPTVHQIGGGGGENGGSSNSNNGGVGSYAPRNGSELLDQLVYLYGEIKEKTAKLKLNKF
jgi:hypothetical protein